MIKPSDLSSIPRGDRTAQAEIEHHIDEHISRHHKSAAAWPLVIENQRSGWSQLDVDAVLARYRATGWKVTTGYKDAIAAFSPPDAPNAA